MSEKIQLLRQQILQTKDYLRELTTKLNESVFLQKYEEIEYPQTKPLKDENGNKTTNEAVYGWDGASVWIFDTCQNDLDIILFSDPDFELKMKYWENISKKEIEEIIKYRKN